MLDMSKINYMINKALIPCLSICYIIVFTGTPLLHEAFLQQMRSSKFKKLENMQQIKRVKN